VKAFINEAMEKALSDYLNSKDKPESVLYNSFLVVVIRMLILMYNELDIINPYKLNNEDAFDMNLMKYGAKKEKIDNFKRLLDGFYVIEKRNSTSLRREENIYFIEVQKILIDLFNIKRCNFGVSDEETKEFFDLLYTPGTSNALRLSYNYLNAPDIYEVAEYYKSEFEKNQAVEEKEKKELLGFDIYKLFNVSINDLSKMSGEDIKKLNSDIYRMLDISETSMNKDFLLREKFKELTTPKKVITSGNGYVDILLIMSIIVTVIMSVVVVATIIF
jgi:hypothetical protein